MAKAMRLRHVVITSVNRDDLADGGSGHFAATIKELHAALPQARVEVLTPDFQGDPAAVARVLDAGPHIFNHNMETVPRLYRRVRPQADYRQSLDVLQFAKRYRDTCMKNVLTKSGAMLGLGRLKKKSISSCGICVPPMSTSSRWVNTCSPPAAICRWSSSFRPRSLTRIATSACPLDSNWCSADLSFEARIWQT
jgi:hypothetical protein